MPTWISALWTTDVAGAAVAGVAEMPSTAAATTAVVSLIPVTLCAFVAVSVSTSNGNAALSRFVLRIAGHHPVVVSAEPDTVPTQVKLLRLHRLHVAVHEAHV